MKFKNGLPVVMTCAAVCVFAVSQSILAPLALLIGKDFGHGVAWSGLFFAAYYILNIFACPFAGRIISAVGHHHAVSVGLLVFAVSSLLLSFADRFLFVCLCLAAIGVAAYFMLLACIEVLCALMGRTYAASMPDVAALLGIGAVIGAVYTGLMLFQEYSWRNIYFWLGVVLAVFALVYAVIPSPTIAWDEAWQDELSSALRLRRMYSSYLVLFLYAGAEITATGWMAGYMMRSLGYTTMIAAIAGILMWICVTIGRIICARLSASVPAARIATMLTILLVAALCLCAVIPDGRLFWFAVFAIGLGLSGLWPLIVSAALSGNSGGATLSVIFAWECAGAALLPFAAGILGSWIGMRIVVLIAVCLFAVVGILMQGMLSSKRGSVRVRRVSRTFPKEREIDMDDEAS